MTDKTSTRCLKVLALLPRFIENDFTPEEAEEIRAHLAACPSCWAEYEAMRGLVDTLESLPNIGVPPTFKDAVMRHLPPTEDPEGS